MMLRITETDASEGALTLHLEGWVAEQTAAELEAACEIAMERGALLALDVRFVDVAGATLLRELRQRGCTLGGASPFVLEMIERGAREGDCEASGESREGDAGRSPDEVELLRELRRGSQAAFESLVRRNAGPLLAVARRFLPTDEDARDAVQEAFTSAFKALPSFAGGAKLSTWLHRIVVNAALMRLRSRRRRPEESIDDLLPCFDERGEWVSTGTGWSRRRSPRWSPGRCGSSSGAASIASPTPSAACFSCATSTSSTPRKRRRSSG